MRYLLLLLLTLFLSCNTFNEIEAGQDVRLSLIDPCLRTFILDCPPSYYLTKCDVMEPCFNSDTFKQWAQKYDGELKQLREKTLNELCK